MRKDFEMSEEDLAKILHACKPVPYIAVAGIEPYSPQERANMAWSELGERLGFDYLTVRSNGGGDRFFSAEVK